MSAAVATRVVTKSRIHLLEQRVPRGLLARRVKKVRPLLCQSIVFVAIAMRGNTTRPTQRKSPVAPIANRGNTKSKLLRVLATFVQLEQHSLPPRPHAQRV